MSSTRLDHADPTTSTSPDPTSSGTGRLGWAWPALRIAMGLVFAWAFVDKLFALGFTTGRDPETGAVERFGPAAWINGGSPTSGFLEFGADGPFAGVFQAMAGSPVVDVLFMLGMGGAGLGLLLGIATRLTTFAGIALMASIRLALPVPENNPVVDDHLVYILVLLVLAVSPQARRFSLAGWWQRLPLVQRVGLLR